MHSPGCSAGNHSGGSPVSPEDASAAFDLLSDHRRRILLHCLRERTGNPVELDALLSSWVEECPGAADAFALRIEARHVHLPKLDASGAVDYDPEDGTIRYLGGPVLEVCLENLRDLDVDG